MSSSKKRQLVTGNKNKKGAVSSSSLVKISGQRRSRDYEVDPVLAAQRSQKWHDMPYAALQLIALYNCKTAYNAIVLGLVYSRLDDTIANYLPADMWRRFYDHLVSYNCRKYRIRNKTITQAKLPTPETLEQYAHASRYWQSLIDDARALRETFRGVENMPDSWSVHALGTVADWDGVKVESGRVTGVDLCEKFLRGSVDLTKLPVGLQVLRLRSNKFSGSADLTRLPVGLQYLNLDGNKLWGSVDLTKLPAGLQELRLNSNKLSGSVDLTRLPVGLQELNLSNNKLSGSVDLTKLPAGLQELRLDSNNFEGSVDLTQLPAELRLLRLDRNKLSGSVDLTKLPAGLQELRLGSNNFEGSVDLTQLPAELRLLRLNRNKLSGSVDLTQLPVGFHYLNLTSNLFSGSIDLSKLPAEGMYKFQLQDNMFSGSTSVNHKSCDVYADGQCSVVRAGLISFPVRFLNVEKKISNSA